MYDVQFGGWGGAQSSPTEVVNPQKKHRVWATPMARMMEKTEELIVEDPARRVPQAELQQFG